MLMHEMITVNVVARHVPRRDPDGGRDVLVFDPVNIYTACTAAVAVDGCACGGDHIYSGPVASVPTIPRCVHCYQALAPTDRREMISDRLEPVISGILP